MQRQRQVRVRLVVPEHVEQHRQHPERDAGHQRIRMREGPPTADERPGAGRGADGGSRPASARWPPQSRRGRRPAGTASRPPGRRRQPAGRSSPARASGHCPQPAGQSSQSGCYAESVCLTLAPPRCWGIPRARGCSTDPPVWATVMGSSPCAGARSWAADWPPKGGSSPRARGAHREVDQRVPDLRIILAREGAHPRLPVHDRPDGIIPACAGSAPTRRCPDSCRADHPPRAR